MSTSHFSTIDNDILTESINKVFTKANAKIFDCDVTAINLENILNGKLGLAYYALALYKNTGDKVYLSLIEKVVNDIFNKCNSGTSFTKKISLAEGLSGLGIVLNDLVEASILPDEFTEQVNLINDLALEKCREMLQVKGFDYFYGATGLLFYLVEVKAYNYCNEIIDYYYNHAKNHGFIFYNETDDVYTEGINFGFAHGSVSILSVFMRIYELGIETTKSKEIILKLTENLLLYSRDKLDFSKVNHMYVGYEYPSVFPYNVITSSQNKDILPWDTSNLFHYTDRLGWCNSDLSFLLMLYKIGYTFNQPHLIQVANTIGNSTVKRKDYSDTAISDCYICHGSSGVALIYKKLYSLTGQIQYKEAYQYWIKVTVDYMEKEFEKTYSVQDMELLTGWLGPLLTLYSYNNEERYNWDKIFLI